MIATILTLIVALEHLYIIYMEMFAWETRGKRFFRLLPPDLFTPTRSMAANQGLYNGFLAAGLVWSFFMECERPPVFPRLRGCGRDVWRANGVEEDLLCAGLARHRGDGLRAGEGLNRQRRYQNHTANPSRRMA